MPRNTSLALTLLSEQLDSYHLQRHDFMNHWQVIMGYLQLGNADKALSYMRKALQGLQAEQVIGQIPQPIVEACLLGFVISLRAEGLEVEAHMSDSIKTVEFWKEFWQEEYGQALYGYTSECLVDLKDIKVKSKQVRVQVLIEGVRNFTLCVRLLDGEDVIRENLFTLDSN